MSIYQFKQLVQTIISMLNFYGMFTCVVNFFKFSLSHSFYSLPITEAQLSQLGYIEDLERERPKLIAIEIKQCQPKELTIFEDEWLEKIDSNISEDISA